MVCNQWMVVCKSMLTVGDLTPKIQMTVDYCRRKPVQRLGCALATLEKCKKRSSIT